MADYDIEILPQELKELLIGGVPADCILLDVRQPWEHKEADIEGSLLMPMREVPLRAAKELDPKKRIIAFCHSGMRSMTIAMWLRDNGFEQVQSLAGGIQAWLAEGNDALRS